MTCLWRTEHRHGTVCDWLQTAGAQIKGAMIIALIPAPKFGICIYRVTSPGSLACWPLLKIISLVLSLGSTISQSRRASAFVRQRDAGCEPGRGWPESSGVRGSLGC